MLQHHFTAMKTTKLILSVVMILLSWGCQDRRTITLEISLPNLRSVHFSGTIKDKTKGEFEAEKFKIELHEASDFNAAVKANEIKSQMHGSLVLILRSSVAIGLYTTQVLGTSRVETYNLPTRSTYIQTFGASKGYVNASNDLIASSDGISRTRYMGEPKNLMDGPLGAFGSQWIVVESCFAVIAFVLISSNRKNAQTVHEEQAVLLVK